MQSIIEPALMFTSPSGDGLKIIFAIDTFQASHADFFAAFQNFFRSEFNQNIDKQCKDVARATFLCYDPECFYTENPTILGADFLNKYRMLKQPDKQQEKIKPPTTTESKEVAFDILCAMIQRAKDGEKHGELLKAARLAGGYIKAGHLEEKEVYNRLKAEIDKKKTISNFEAAYNTLKEGIEYGKNDPIDPPQTGTPFMPLDGFPIEIQQLINECSEVYGTNRDLWTAGILAATASAIGQSVILKTKYENPPLLWISIVGASGVGKSEPIDFAYRPMHEADLIEFKAHQREMHRYKEECRRTKRGAEKPEPPSPRPQHIVIDITPEALAQAMGIQPRGITLIRDELVGMIADFGRYGKSAEEQNMLSTWTQSTYKVNRKNGENEFIEKPYLNIIGGIQPGLLTELANNNRAINGFLPRFCFVFPDKIKTPTYNNNELSYEGKKLYRDYIGQLMTISGLRNETRLSREAEQLYADFMNKNAALNDSGKQPDYLNEVNAKLNIIVLRLAILFHYSQQVFSGSDSAFILAPVMQSAINLTEYFRITAKKVHQVINQNGINKIDVAKYLNTLGNSQNEIASVLKVSQPYINKVLRL